MLTSTSFLIEYALLTSMQFDTCVTHKNKVTCPMCRKQLIEPLGYPGAFFDAMNRGPGWRAFASELRRADWADM
jgi:hypothetical protein